MSLNQHQREYVAYLGKQPREALCWCGWYPVAECGKWCERSGKGITAADKDKETCVECGSSPFQPGGKVVHNLHCSANEQSTA